MQAKKILSIIFICLSYYSSVSQELVNNHWHFGTGMDLDFSTTPPSILPSNINTPGTTEPASISDEFGNILAFSDGGFLYNSNGNVVDNGTFSNASTENIFAPIPGEEFRYYLFRSGIGFVDYSIVDLSANGGQGYIDPVEKQTEIHPHQSQLLITSHANQIDNWLIMIDNNSGSGSDITVNVHLITDSGIQMQTSYSNTYIFATWYNSLEEARISSNCNRIATSYKGHYIVMFDFDNLSGDITEAFPTSVGLPDSFSLSQLNYLEFSETSEYLYVIQDHITITRFDANENDPALFMASGEEFPVSSINNWSHIKKGRDGAIYLLDVENQTIDVLSNPDEVDISDVIFEDSLITITNDAIFFPNTFSFCLTPQSLNTQNVCEGNIANFNASGYEFADSLFWDVEIPQSNDTLFFSNSGAVNLLEPGTYEVIFNYLVDTIWYQILDSIVVYEQPNVDLGLDMVLCNGETILLEAGNSNFNYEWSTGSMEDQILVSSPGSYSVQITNAICFASDEVAIDFLFEPTFELPDSVFCGPGVALTLYALTQNASDFIWNTQETSNFISVFEPGDYWVTASNDCFTFTDTSHIETVVFIDPIVDPFFTICGMDTLIVHSNWETGENTWSNGQVNEFASILGEGLFTLTINDQGCEKSENFEVNRLEMANLEGIIYPNVFTPNSDEVNEIFRPFDPFYPSLDPCEQSTFKNILRIYDRWGIELQSIGCSWDGTEGGIEYSPGVYFFVSELSTNCLDYENYKILSGSFEVFRK